MIEARAADLHAATIKGAGAEAATSLPTIRASAPGGGHANNVLFTKQKSVLPNNVLFTKNVHDLQATTGS